MGCRILVGREWNRSTEQYEQSGAAFYDSVTDTMFGRLMQSEYEAERFLKWLDCDPRKYSHEEVCAMYDDFVHGNVCECGTLRDVDSEGEPGSTDERYECAMCKEKRKGKQKRKSSRKR